MKLLANHGRYAYSAIHERPSFAWPDGARLAVYIALNLEEYAFGEGLTEELAPGGPQPDVLNFSWRDYGNRVGAWRLLELFDALALPCAALLNTEIYRVAPSLPAAFRARGDEIVCHGRSNSERQGGLSEADEATLIREATETIAHHEARAPEGWLGPWISETERTPELLRLAGYRYVLDWCMDDQPVWLATRAGPLLAVPYPQELNDSNAIVARRMNADAFADMIVDNFEEMRAQAAVGPALVMGIALHAYVAGQPFRLRHLRRALAHLRSHATGVWFTHPGRVATHFASAVPPPPISRR
jgi:peptidoglycan/xylan/chitin deacetylase (PgdA/CDA1 family)